MAVDRVTRVCIYSHRAAMGSGAMHSLRTLLACRPAGVRCLVVMPTVGDAVDALAADGVEIAVIPHYWNCGGAPKSPPGRYLCRFIRWRRQRAGRSHRHKGNREQESAHVAAVARWAPNVIYTNTSVIPMGFRMAQRLERPHVLHVREFATLDHGLLPDESPKRAAATYARSTVIANSRAVGAFICQQYGNCQPIVIYNGVYGPAPPSFQERDVTEPLRLLMVGRVREAKGQFEAVRALALLGPLLSRIKLDIVGDGDLPGLRAVVAECGLGQVVQVHGPSRDVAQFYSRADIYLMCSHHEAFGLCTVEAMLHGVAVIGRDSEYCATGELIEHGETGVLYRGGPSELADAIRLLIGDVELRKRIGQEARERARTRFDPKRYADDVWRVIVSAALRNHTNEQD